MTWNKNKRGQGLADKMFTVLTQYVLRLQAMKQMTLLDMKGKKSGGESKSNSPKKLNASPRKQTPVKLPPIVTK